MAKENSKTVSYSNIGTFLFFKIILPEQEDKAEESLRLALIMRGYSKDCKFTYRVFSLFERNDYVLVWLLEDEAITQIQMEGISEVVHEHYHLAESYAYLAPKDSLIHFFVDVESGILSMVVLYGQVVAFELLPIDLVLVSYQKVLLDRFYEEHQIDLVAGEHFHQVERKDKPGETFKIKLNTNEVASVKGKRAKTYFLTFFMLVILPFSLGVYYYLEGNQTLDTDDSQRREAIIQTEISYTEAITELKALQFSSYILQIKGQSGTLEFFLSDLKQLDDFLNVLNKKKHLKAVVLEHIDQVENKGYHIQISFQIKG